MSVFVVGSGLGQQATRELVPWGAIREDHIRAQLAACKVGVLLLQPGWADKPGDVVALFERWERGEVTLIRAEVVPVNTHPSVLPRGRNGPVPLDDINRIEGTTGAEIEARLARAVAEAEAAVEVADEAVALGRTVEVVRAAYREVVGRRERFSEDGAPPLCRRLAVQLHRDYPDLARAFVQRLAAHVGQPVVLKVAASGPELRVTHVAHPAVDASKLGRADLREKAAAVLAHVAAKVGPDAEVVFRFDGRAEHVLQPFGAQELEEEPVARRYRAVCAWPEVEREFGPEPLKGRVCPGVLDSAGIEATTDPKARAKGCAGVIVSRPEVPNHCWASCESVSRHHEHTFRVLVDVGDPAMLKTEILSRPNPTLRDVFDVVRDHHQDISMPVIWTDPSFAAHEPESMER